MGDFRYRPALLFLDRPASPRLILFPVILGIAAIVAFVGSLIPLRRASHFNPAPILRGE